MLKDQLPACHEFWLEKRGWPIYRIALGELIEAGERQTFPPKIGQYSPDWWNKSGSVGFMNLARREEWVPKEGAIEHAKFIYLEDEPKMALVILEAGIEPSYRGDLRLLSFLHKLAINKAQEWGLDILVLDMIQNQRLKLILPRLGYTLYSDGLKAVKRLK